LSDINLRSSGITDDLKDYRYHILGCGAIGSSAAFQLIRMGASSLTLYDMDKVEVQNVGVSRYILSDINKRKVDALSEHLMSINDTADITRVRGKFKTFRTTLDDKDIVILGFDNMRSRLKAAKECFERNSKPYLLIDGRMGAEQYQQYTLLNPSLEAYKATWYSDAEGESTPCNAKATSYCSDMAGAFITNAVRKVLTDNPVPQEFYFDFPSFVLARVVN